MKVPGSKIVPCQGVLGSNHSLTFGLFTQVSSLGPLGPLVCFGLISDCGSTLKEKICSPRSKVFPFRIDSLCGRIPLPGEANHEVT